VPADAGLTDLRPPDVSSLARDAAIPSIGGQFARKGFWGGEQFLRMSVVLPKNEFLPNEVDR
jgi:hypothetical protein